MSDDIRRSMFDKVPPNMAVDKTFPHFKSWLIAEKNFWGMEQANRVNYGLMLWEQGKWEAIYRLVFPEEAPWGRVQLGPLTTCSPYQWEKLINRLKELLAASNKQPADNWEKP